MLSPVGVPDILKAARLSRAQADLKQRLDVARTELATGEAVDKPGATGGDPMRLFALDNALAAIESRRPLIELARSRAAGTQNALETAQNTVGDMPVDLLAFAEIGDAASAARVARDARAMLGQVVAALNVSVGGRHVFAGDAALGAPLAPAETLLADVRAALAGTLLGPIAPAVDPPTPEAQLDHYFGTAPIAGAPPGTTFAENVWRGGDGAAPPVELADGDRLAYAIRADAAPLVELIRQLAVIASVEGAPATTFPDQAARLDAWKAAAHGVLGAVDAITRLRGDLGADERRIDEAAAAQEAEKATLAAARARLIGRDEYETATLVRQLENQLETVYAMTARTFQLTLLNFLR